MGQSLNKNLIFSFLGSVSFLIFFRIIISKWGLGVSPDSVYYLAGAESILEGKGYTFLGNWIYHWPPGYSTLIALFNLCIPFSLHLVAGILQALFFLLFAFIMDQIFASLNPGHWCLRWIINVALMLSIPLAVTSTMVSTELLYILIQMSAFYLFLKWQKDPSIKFIYIIGGLMAMAILVRFAAIAFFVNLSIMVLWKSKPQKRLSNFIVYVCGALILPCLYYFITRLFYEGAPPREFVFHPIEWTQIKWSYWYFRGWFNELPGFNSFFLIVISLIFISPFKRSYQDANATDLTTIFMVFNIVSYYLFLIFSATFFDKHIPLDNRLMAPIAPFFFILLFKISIYFKLKFGPWTAGFFVLFVLISSLFSSFRLWKSHYSIGQQYSGKEFSEYKTILTKYVANSSRIIYTNAPDYLFFNGYISREIPSKINPNSGLTNQLILKEIEEMKKLVADSSAQIILFNRVDWRNYHISLNEIKQVLPDSKEQTIGTAVRIQQFE